MPKLASFPGVFLLGLLSLALSIAFTLAFLSLADALFLDPLQFDTPRRLLVIQEFNPSKDIEGTGVAPANFADLQAFHGLPLEGAAAMLGISRTVTGMGLPAFAQGVACSPQLFQMLGLKAAAGRTLAEIPDSQPRHKAVVLSYSFWQNHFAGRAEAVGAGIALDGEPYQVAGVLQPGPGYPRETDFWIELSPVAGRMMRFRSLRLFDVVAKTEEGADVEKLASALEVFSARLRQSYPKSMEGWHLKAIPLQEHLYGDLQPYLVLLLATAAALLLICCANVGGLFLARATQRAPSYAVRLALGSSRKRLLADFLKESLFFTMLGGLVGGAMGWYLIRQFGWILSDHLDPSSLGLESEAVWATLVFCLSAGFLLGWIPYRRTLKADLGQTLRTSRAGLSVTKATWTAHQGLLVGQMSLSFMLLATAALLTATLSHLRTVHPGFSPEKVWAMEVRLDVRSYQQDSKRRQFAEQVLARIRALPHVSQTGLAVHLPLDGRSVSYPVKSASDAQSQPVQMQANVVDQGFFRALEIPFLQGATMTEPDSGQPQAVLSRSAARQLFPDLRAVDREIEVGKGKYRVTGIVEDIRFRSLGEEHSPMVYLSFLEAPWTQFHFLIRDSRSEAASFDVWEGFVREEDAAVPILSIETMSDLWRGSILHESVRSFLVTSFALLALALTFVGVFGAVSYQVQGRLREVGIRLACGATPSTILRRLLWSGIKLCLAAIGLGSFLSYLAISGLRDMLYEIQGAEPWIFVLSGAVLVASTLLASYFPAYRAASVDPAQLFRNDS